MAREGGMMGKAIRRLAWLVPALLAISAPAAYTSIFVEQPDVNLGFVYRDQPQEMTFVIENLSGDTLRILAVEPSCDCTTARVIPEAIGPQGKAEAHVFFDPRGYETKGKVKEGVNLITSDHKTPEVSLTFTVEVGIGPEPEPRALDFGKVAPGASDTLSLMLHPGIDKPTGRPMPLAVTGAASDNDRVTVKQKGKTGAGGYEFAVMIANPAGGGQVAGFVTLETSDSTRGAIRIPVAAVLAGGISVEPGVLAFGPTLPGKYLQQTLRVSSSSAAGFKIANVSCSADQLDFEVKPLAQNAYELRIKVKEGARPGRVMGEIRIQTDLAGEPAAQVKVTGHVRSPK
jgi:hypothetical protein